MSHIKSIRPTDAEFPTDHQLLEFDLSVYNCRAKNHDHLVYNFKAADALKISCSTGQCSTREHRRLLAKLEVHSCSHH